MTVYRDPETKKVLAHLPLEVAPAKAKAMFEAAWELLSRRLGSKKAKGFALKIIEQEVGRKRRNDELDSLIKLYLSASQCALASTNSRKNILPASIRDAILAAPPQVRPLRRDKNGRPKSGPNAGMLRDPKTGEEFFDPDSELEPGLYAIKIKPASLLKRIERIMDEMIEAGQLDKKYKRSHQHYRD